MRQQQDAHHVIVSGAPPHTRVGPLERDIRHAGGLEILQDRDRLRALGQPATQCLERRHAFGAAAEPDQDHGPPGQLVEHVVVPEHALLEAKRLIEIAGVLRQAAGDRQRPDRVDAPAQPPLVDGRLELGDRAGRLVGRYVRPAHPLDLGSRQPPWHQSLACSAALSSMPRPVRGRASSAPVTELRQNSSPSTPDRSRALTTRPSGSAIFEPAVM